MAAEIIPLRLSTGTALRVIRDIAQDSSNIVVVKHGRQRGYKRSITRAQIEACIRKGVIVEGPFVNGHGNWQVTLQRHAAGEEIECAVAIEWRTKLIVITVF